MLIISICTVLSFISVSQGDDLFESLAYRQDCYKYEQCGCNETFIQRFKNVSRSANNLTEADTYFYLFTKERPDKPELLHNCNGTLPPNSTFDPNCTTEIYLPGFMSGICNMAPYRELKNERLKCGCFNVILVDWMWGNKLDLIEAKNNILIVAQQLIILIEYLKNTFGLGPEKFILTGHSLGAHMAAYVTTGTNVTNANGTKFTNGTKVGIINGLDPAGVIDDFAENAPLDRKLDAGDAEIDVIVLHTNAWQCLPRGMGINYTAGTADFFFNDGVNQPACKAQILLSILKADYFYALITLYPAACSHLQCLYYYKASMNTTDCLFAAVKCNSSKEFNNGSCGKDCGSDGGNCALAGAYGSQCLKPNQRNGTNNYYLNTTDCCPYCNDGAINTTGVKCLDSDFQACKRKTTFWPCPQPPLPATTLTTPKLPTSTLPVGPAVGPAVGK